MERTSRGLKYRVTGQGEETIIFHPSLGMGRFLFYRLIPPLSRHFRVISYDPRGIGENRELAPLLEEWVQDVGDLVDMVSGPVHLVGVSLGTWVMARAARAWPERVAKLVLMGTTVGFSRGAEAVSERRDQLSQLSMPEFARLYVAQTFTPPIESEYEAQFLDELSAVSKEQYLASMEAIYLTDNRAVFSDLKVPTLILVGSRDERTTPQMADSVAALIEGSQVYVIPRAGHLALVEYPTRVEELIESFLLNGELPE